MFNTAAVIAHLNTLTARPADDDDDLCRAYPAPAQVTRTVTEHRIAGPNSGETPFVATQAEAEARLATYDRYQQYGHVHTLQTRTVTTTQWA